ncbi:MAG: C-GCAxxG-C-C family protein [Syntrophorhabdaceae bacterium]|nr:C-GCAxxG-C-C family protein [Syntrophorhabdaceae bacterium]
MGTNAESEVLHLNERMLEVAKLNGMGYCCTQIMAIMMLRNMGRENPDLVRSLGGLCKGIADSGETCGVLLGGACLISLLLGKGSDDETPKGDLPFAIHDLTDWFERQTRGPYGGKKCRDILAVSPDKKACLKLILETYEKVLSILETYGVHPAAETVNE